MGPEGGERGGKVIAHGTPEQIATVTGSYTGQFLARHYTAQQLAGSRNGVSHAGPQPPEIAAPDRVKAARGKFVAPEKKTGMPLKNGEKGEAVKGRQRQVKARKRAAKGSGR
jgi:excinuclease ABC subunit A